ncbi:hypothetical protein HDU76_004838, partial [Blyttiomyces sp. JEL0837]
MVGSSFLLSDLTQTKFDYHDKKIKAISKQEELKISTDKKPLNIQEEYFKLTSKPKDWDMVRVPRPAGVEDPVFKK